MLLHLSTFIDLSDKKPKQKCLFYTNPHFNEKILQDRKELIKLKISVKKGKNDKSVVQCKNLDISKAMGHNEMIIIDFHKDRKESDNSAYRCEKLQKGLEGWMTGGPVTVLQSDDDSK